MTLPTWVAELIARLPETYTGQLRLNVFEGGVRDVTYESRATPPERNGRSTLTLTK